MSLFPQMKKKTYRKSDKNNKICEVFSVDDTIKTKIGQAILKVIGPSKQLTKFDKDKRLMDAAPSVKSYRDTYKSGKTGIVGKLKAFHVSAATWIKTWEKQYCLETFNVPTLQDIQDDKLVSIVHEKKQLAEKIITTLYTDLADII